MTEGIGAFAHLLFSFGMMRENLERIRSGLRAAIRNFDHDITDFTRNRRNAVYYLHFDSHRRLDVILQKSANSADGGVRPISVWHKAYHVMIDGALHELILVTKIKGAKRLHQRRTRDDSAIPHTQDGALLAMYLDEQR